MKNLILICFAIIFSHYCAGQTADTIKAKSKNRIGITYDYLYYQKPAVKAQHLLSLEYIRYTGIGPLLLRSNFAERYHKKGIQFEADAYPKISKRFYSYISAGFSPDRLIFPKFRAGISLFANLPLAFEAEAGLRYLYFNKGIPVYTASIGKYAGNWWINARGFFSNNDSSTSQSLFLTTRYYVADADNYLSFQIGTGTSPDEVSRISQFANIEILSSSRIQVGYRKSFGLRNVITLQTALVRNEYSKDAYGNQYNAVIQYQRKFK